MKLPSFVPSGATPPIRILLVDDAEPERGLFADFLRELGFRVFIGENGRDGYQKACAIIPDLILMDIRMPECDGITACRLLKADPRTASIPLIFLTAAALPEERVLGLTEGAVDYITKPYNLDEVRLRIGIHLNFPFKKENRLDSAKLETTEPENLGTSSADSVIFRAAKHILAQDLASTPSLTSLASAVGTNSRRLNEAFRKFAGTTVFNYLFEMRMQEARRLLADTAVPIQTISSTVGYTIAANFSTAFRERFGLSPRQYRKEPNK